VDASLHALADGTRRQILSLVWNKERPAGEIAAHFSLTRPAVSQHLSVLLESDLVAVRQEGTRRLYHVNRDRIEALRAELDAFWGGRMAKLKTAAERAQKEKRKRR
jgi:DNA-binding transcriptional ArsR family regulator